jgi:hypothetical protein
LKEREPPRQIFTDISHFGSATNNPACIARKHKAKQTDEVLVRLKLIMSLHSTVMQLDPQCAKRQIPPKPLL